MNLENIPYRYNTATTEECDCWGLVRLYYQQLGVDLPSHQNYYEQCPTELDLNFAQLARLINCSDFDKVQYLIWQDIVVGFSEFAFGFGVYLGGGKILTTAHGKGSYVMQWEDWKQVFQSSHFYRHKKAAILSRGF